MILINYSEDIENINDTQNTNDYSNDQDIQNFEVYNEDDLISDYTLKKRLIEEVDGGFN